MTLFLLLPQISKSGAKFSTLIILLLIVSTSLAVKAAVEPVLTSNTVYYPGQPRQDYYTDLLQLALSYPCQQRYQLQASKLDLPKKRAFDLMNAGQGIDVMYGSASTERLAQYRAVTFPILRGLMGLRIALTSNEGKDRLQQIYSVPALAQLRVGQFTTWSDTAILRANGFNVETGSDVEGIYQMLALGRIDYFPRSVLEIQQNQAEHIALNLQIDPHIMLYYPTATYYYVGKDNIQLADAILCGLERAQQDGKLNQFLNSTTAAYCNSCKLINADCLACKIHFCQPACRCSGQNFGTRCPKTTNQYSEKTDRTTQYMRLVKST